jgi:phage gp36-like protein
MYCTKDDIVADIGERELIQISNDTENATSVDETIVEDKIAEIGVYIDSYLTESVTLPITDANDLLLIKKICVSLVVCDLYQRRLKLDYSDSLSERRKLAVADLEKIQNGKIVLASKKSVSDSSHYSRVSQRTKYFTDESLRGY